MPVKKAQRLRAVRARVVFAEGSKAPNLPETATGEFFTHARPGSMQNGRLKLRSGAKQKCQN